jgi:cytochrome P450
MEPAFDFDLLSPDNLADPYPLYRALREHAPVWRGPQGQWVLTRYADVAAALHDTRLLTGADFGRVQQYPPELRDTVREMMQPTTLMMVMSNPPHHTRVRALVSKAMTPQAAEALRPAVQSLADRLLDPIVARADPATGEGACDVVADFAFDLPATVVCTLLGIPPGDHAAFREWAENLAVLWGVPPKQDVAGRVAQCQHSVQAIRTFFRDLIAQRRSRPQADLISALLAAHENGEALSEEEVIWNCILLLIAGHETVQDTIGNGLLALLRHPDQMQLLRQDLSRTPTALEELWRYDCPFQFMQREAGEDLMIGGQPVRKGERVWAVIAAANHDPAAFPDPDRLDLARPHHQHASFGFGAHYCVGAPLARVEAQVAFDRLLRRLADIRLAADRLEYVPKVPNRGLRALPVTFRVAPEAGRAGALRV